MAACRYLVKGRVQGVGYRYFVARQAGALGVAGYASNLSDGDVEVWAEGSETALASLESSLRDGPSFSEVSSVSREAAAPRGEKGFRIR